jgi:hypothetical protein
MAPTQEARARLKDDYPELIKQRIYLLGHGKAQTGKQRCIVCGTRGTFGELWIPAEVLSPMPGAAKPQAYWCCEHHHANPPTDDELVRLLAAKMICRPGEN